MTQPVSLHTPLSELDWLNAQRQRQLKRLGMLTVADVLTHFPRRYEDRRKFDRFPTGDAPNAVCVCGVVKAVKAQFLRGGLKQFEAVLEEDHAHALSTPLICRWFNAHWVQKTIAVGQRLVVYGKPKRSGPKVVVAHPEFEVVEDDAQNSLHLQRITPIHGATEGLSARIFRQIVWDTLARLDPALAPGTAGAAPAAYYPWLPAELDATSPLDALKQIHFPDSWEAQQAARRHLVVAEFLRIQLCVGARRLERQTRPGHSHCGAGALMDALHGSLGFALTGAQRRAIDQIRADLAAPRPMNRLLHGDVGSGKTLVALSAMLLAVEAGYQTALMAPTQILAEQHYLNFKRLLGPLGVRVALRTGARQEDNAPSAEQPELDLLNPAARSSAPQSAPQNTPQNTPQNAPQNQVFVGTHALLSEHPDLNRVGLVVIDEQHKFGVLQRARLRAQGAEPDVLVMSATPIPRTLTMTVFGDLDLSTLDEAPANRGKIITAARDAAKLPEAIKFVREQLEAGRQAYIVYPLIDASETLEAKAAAVEFEKWQPLLAPWRCELLHGRIGAEEKDAIMERFRAGRTQALIATTVIEVGIDVPNATLMLIENAERFGLAQLHQLRGRIGRGPHKSYCVLLSAKLADAEAQEKLRIFSETSDGFEIAEADLRLRGAGDLLGTAQSGLPPLKLGDLVRDSALMHEVRAYVVRLLAEDPALARPANQALQPLLAASRALAQES